MPRSSGKHLSKAHRELIEEGIRSGRSARNIAAMLDVSASTVTREVKTNRTIREPNRKRSEKLSLRCARYADCQESGSACKNCTTRYTTCKHCKTRTCIDSCANFIRKRCPATEKWPYICPSNCQKRRTCSYPKCHYDATDADRAYRERLSCAREGIDISPEELAAMIKIVVPLVKQGQSFEAIWSRHSDELPCSLRSAYTYQAKGLFGIADVALPRKVRMKKRKRAQYRDSKRERIDRTGRTYDDYQDLPLADKVRVVQCDSVEGYECNVHDVLSMHIVSCTFQLYLYKRHGDPSATVEWLDVIERTLGSPEAFKAIFGILLCDRGVEFDDWAGMERSCLEPNVSRCRVFYCDAMNSNQKSNAERNHEQLRRILPKGRSDFDKLDVYDLAVCSSHVNSYPLASRAGKCPFDLLGDLLPKELLDELGLEKLPADEVILKPYLMAHAVEL